jgi:hypothetical protein
MAIPVVIVAVVQVCVIVQEVVFRFQVGPFVFCLNSRGLGRELPQGLETAIHKSM